MKAKYQYEITSRESFRLAVHTVETILAVERRMTTCKVKIKRISTRGRILTIEVEYV